MDQRSTLRNLKYNLLLPFRNLTPQQSTLQIFRFATSFITLCLVIVFLLLQHSTVNGYVARINCSHIDVASGLYDSLTTTLSSNDASIKNDILPINLGLTDSEISLLTLYTEEQVSDAPQYILLGKDEYCEVDYDSDYDEPMNKRPRQNETKTCYLYNGKSLFSYRNILLDADLDIILAYAYDTGNDDKAYNSTAALRKKRFNTLGAVMIFQTCAQFVMLVYGFVLYSNRGSAKDLSHIPTLTLNGIALISVAAGMTMIVGVSIVVSEIINMRTDISNGLGGFGISMNLGKVYFSLIWLSFTFAVFSMLSWTIPLWCSNPKDDGYESDDDTTYIHEPHNNSGEFVVKPYQASRQTKQRKVKHSHSRLFDDSVYADREVDAPLDESSTEEDPFQEVNSSSALHYLDSLSSAPKPMELSSRIHSESELRKLGETMSKKVSVRRLHRSHKSKPQLLGSMPEKEETHNLLYGDNTFSTHQYPQSLPTSSEKSTISRNLTINRNRSRSNTHDSNKKATDTAKFHELEVSLDQNPFASQEDNASLLDQEEMNYLDSNKFINRIA